MNGRRSKVIRKQAGSKSVARKTRKTLQMLKRMQSQRIAPVKERTRMPIGKGAPPSWPRSKDQRKQSRPLIVLSPMRLFKSKFGKIKWMMEEFEAICKTAPKHVIDAHVLSRA